MRKKDVAVIVFKSVFCCVKTLTIHTFYTLLTKLSTVRLKRCVRLFSKTLAREGIDRDLAIELTKLYESELRDVTEQLTKIVSLRQALKALHAD